MVQFTHKPVDVRRCVSPNVGDEESDELRWHVVKHRAVHVDLGENLTCHTECREKKQVKIHNTHQKQSGWFSRITFSERKNLLWRNKLVKSVFFIWELNWRERGVLFLFVPPTRKCTNQWNAQICVPVVTAWTWGCRRSAAWSGAWLPGPECGSRWRRAVRRSPTPSASRWWPAGRHSRFTLQQDSHRLKKPFTGETHLIYTRHDRKNGSVRNDGGLDVGFGEAGRHLVSLREKQREKCQQTQLFSSSTNVNVLLTTVTCQTQDQPTWLSASRSVVTTE